MNDKQKELDEITEEWIALIQFVARYRNSYPKKTEHTENQAKILDKLIDKLGDKKIALMREVYE